ncbi:hypothetical protein BKA69DRAFT_1045718 [Paraphysoderma sedebokerense]|nr:hypothetical protein BKA69DRAFT_1045718 [Paraphysoderma sedebokerense]
MRTSEILCFTSVALSSLLVSITAGPVAPPSGGGVIRPPIDTQPLSNLFIEEKVPQGPPNSNGNNFATGRILVTGPTSVLLDTTATNAAIKIATPPPCSGKTATISVTCDAAQPDCSRIKKLDTVVVIGCVTDGVTKKRIMRVAGASGNDVSLDTAFQPSNGENRAAVALSIDYSNSPQFFQQEGLASTADQQGLLTVVNGAQNGIFSSWRDKIKRWIDEVRKVDIDSSTAVTKEIAPNPTTLFEATAGGGKCSAGSSLVAQASMKLTAAAKATATGIFGIKVLGTLVPFDLKEAYFYVRMNGSAEISCELDVALLAEAKKRISFPTVDISPFGIPEVVSLGPQLNFAILGQASLVAQGTIRGAVTIALPEHDVYVGIAGDVSETDQGKAKPPSAPPKIKTTFNESLLINGNVQLSAIPSLDIGIDGLAGAFKATVGVQAQGSLTLVMNSEITREQANLCVNVDAGASISATATLNSKVVSGLGGIAFQSDPVHVYQRCINNSRSDDQGPPVAVSKRSLPHQMTSPYRLQKRQAAGDKFACPPFGIDIPANAPFMTAIDTLGANGYVMLDQCLVDGKPVAPCPGRLGNDVGAPTPPPAGFPVFVGYHGTSAKVAELILTNGPKVLSDKAIDGKNQFGPGKYFFSWNSPIFLFC